MATTVDMFTGNSSIVNNYTNSNSSDMITVYDDNATLNGSGYNISEPHHMEEEHPAPFIVFIFGTFGLGGKQ